MNTLKQRLQMIAMEVSRKAKGTSSSSSDRQRGSDRNNMYSNNGMHTPQHHDGRLGGGSQAPYMSNRGSDHMQSSHQQQMMQQQIPSSHGQQMVNVDDMSSGMRSSSRGGNDMMGQSNSNYGGSSRMHDPRSSSSGNNGSSSLPQRNDPEWKIRIRHKQQRLLLLHHSAKCPHENGTCTVTPHCADMKRLWRHMESCKDNNCRVPHCFSSRAILSHYRKCKESNCPACGPVRETVRK